MCDIKNLIKPTDIEWPEPLALTKEQCEAALKLSESLKTKKPKPWTVIELDDDGNVTNMTGITLKELPDWVKKK